MPKTKTRSSQRPTPLSTGKSLTDRVVKAAGRRPLNRNQLAEKMGVHPNGIARAIGQAHAQGKLVKVEGKGYQRAI